MGKLMETNGIRSVKAMGIRGRPKHRNRLGKMHFSNELLARVSIER